MPDDKKQCSYGCEKWGNWRSGCCPTCRAYLKRAENRPLSWSIERKETIERWGSRLAFVIRGRSRGKVVHLTGRARHG